MNSLVVCWLYRVVSTQRKTREAELTVYVRCCRNLHGTRQRYANVVQDYVVLISDQTSYVAGAAIVTMSHIVLYLHDYFTVIRGSTVVVEGVNPKAHRSNFKVSTVDVSDTVRAWWVEGWHEAGCASYARAEQAVLRDFVTEAALNEQKRIDNTTHWTRT
jgi:hypothetical protein